MDRIGYLVPEFPGQTHMFFWRELQILPRLGLEADLVSTRKPALNIISHTWAQQAMTATYYVAPPSPRELAAAAAELLRDVGRWGRVAASIARAEGLNVKGRARLGALAVAGAQLASLARRRGWKHVHVHSCADAAHVAMFAHLLSDLPYSITLHGPLAGYGPNQREKWRHARFAIVITQRLLAEVREQLAGSLPEHVDVAPMGVELSRFDRTRPYEPWPGRGPYRIFTCGRLNPSKGHDDLIRAAKRLVEQGRDVRVVIAGEDESGGFTYRPVLEALVKELGMTDRVQLLGAVSEDVIRRELESAHVFALASLNEPLGVAIMEAMAMRAPVVVTSGGGVPELVRDGVDGKLVPPRNPAALAAGLDEVLSDPEQSKRLGEAGRLRVESAFDSARSAEALAKRIRES